jgi:hypothetical protein
MTSMQTPQTANATGLAPGAGLVPQGAPYPITGRMPAFGDPAVGAAIGLLADEALERAQRARSAADLSNGLGPVPKTIEVGRRGAPFYEKVHPDGRVTRIYLKRYQKAKCKSGQGLIGDGGTCPTEFSEYKRKGPGPAGEAAAFVQASAPMRFR